MDECVTAYARYVAILPAAKQCRDSIMRRSLFREANGWLQTYFRAEDREIEKRMRMIGRA